MTEKERQEIIELVHNTIHGFFEDMEVDSRPFTKEETLLLEVNKAICEKIKEMPTVERPRGDIEELKELLCEIEEEKDDIDLNKVSEEKLSWYAGFKSGIVL